MTDHAEDAAAQLGGPAGGLLLRQATVLTVNGDGTLDLDIAASGNTAAGVPLLAGYTPSVGDGVMVLTPEHGVPFALGTSLPLAAGDTVTLDRRMMQTGALSVAFTAQNAVDFAVTYPRAFSARPRVFFSTVLNGTTAWNVVERAGGSATGFNARALVIGGGNVSLTMSGSYWAVLGLD